VYLWTYREGRHNYEGWHMTADADACDALLELLDLYSAARFTCRQVVPLRPPSPAVLGVPNNRGGWPRIRTCTEWVIRYSLRTAFRAWSLTADARTATLDIGRDRIADLREGIVDIRAGLGDRSIGPDDHTLYDDQCLWFWWHPAR